MMTSKYEAFKLLQTLIVYYTGYAFLEFHTLTICGIFRGLGFLNWITFANLIVISINIPLCYLLTFTFEYGIIGTRLSFIISGAILFCLYCLIYWNKVDYQDICRVSHIRMKKDSKMILDEINNDNVKPFFQKLQESQENKSIPQ